MKNASLWRSLRRNVAVLAAASVAALTLSMPASATPNGGNPALIDPDRAASLSVHKFEQPVERGAAGNGLPQDTSGLKPLSGIEFQVQKVPNIDLRTNAGWQEAARLTEADISEVVSRVDGVAPVARTTGSGGLAAFDGLDLGLYLVTENLTTAQLASGITGSGPFVVGLPLTDPTNSDKWLYDVHVYPKNNVDAISKTVQDEAATKLGDDVTWTIKGSIPAGGISSRYTITDQLDDRLAYQDAAVSVIPESAGSLLSGTDYTLSHSNGLVTVDFTSAGRTKLDTIKRASASAQVQVVLRTTVESLGNETEDGQPAVISNQAVLFPNDSNTAGIPSEKPETVWGGLDIKKLDENDAVLAGAKFKVYLSKADAESGARPISINGTDTWTSGSNGLTHIDGLRPGTYWMAESKAPAGYALLAEPQQVKVKDNSRSTIELTVNNVPDNGGFTLPFTGGAGIWYFIIGGLGILLVAVGVYLRTRFAKSAPVAS